MSPGKQRAIEELRKQLIQSSASLLGGDESNALGAALRRFFPELKRAFLLDCIPEQGEDIYWVLVSPTEVAEIEISRDVNLENGALC